MVFFVNGMASICAVYVYDKMGNMGFTCTGYAAEMALLPALCVGWGRDTG
jgi:hypothetical protein